MNRNLWTNKVPRNATRDELGAAKEQDIFTRWEAKKSPLLSWEKGVGG
jgi:hypothetical protein